MVYRKDTFCGQDVLERFPVAETAVQDPCVGLSVRVEPGQARWRKFPGVRSVTPKDPNTRFAYRSCGRLPCAFQDFCVLVPKFCTTSQFLQRACHLLSTHLIDLYLFAHFLDSHQFCFFISLFSHQLSFPLSSVPTLFNSCWLTSPQFPLSNFFRAQSK